jgi:hypothetical protein
MKRRAALLAFMCLLPDPLAAQERPALRIERVSTPPAIAAYVDGKTVPAGTHVTGLKQREPGDGTDASVETDVYVSYDDRQLYVVYICRDDPAKVRANLTKREAIMGDDVVGLVLDTYNDGRRSYLFLANPLGIQLDGVSTEGQDDDYSYDTVWTSEGRRTDFGYVVLMALPFKSLRFSNAHAQTWGIAFARLVPRNNESSFWPFITRRIASVGKQLARLDGLAGISPGRNLLAIPYGNFAADRVLGDSGYVSDQSARIGLDAKAVIKDTVTVDATVNPDFSQVESDEPQVTINQRFEVFFPEKRPFFIENASYFTTPETLFFSRRVADPRLGARVTGKAGRWAFGALVTDDEAPGTRVDKEDERFDRTAGVAVFRLQRDFAGQSYLGGIFTDREWGPTANRVGGVDGRWRVGNNWSLTGQGVYSSATGVDGESRSGSLVTASVQRQGRGFEISTRYLQVSPGFQADLGFVRRRDIKQAETEFGYTWHFKDRKVLNAGADVEAGVIWDFAGALQEWSIEPGVDIELPGQTQVDLRHWNTFEKFGGQEFRRHSTGLFASTEWLSWLSVNGGGELGSGVNYYPAAGLDPFLASSMSAELTVTVKPASRLRIDQSYLYSRLSTREARAGCGCAGGTDAGAPIFSNHILRTRVNLQFTRALSLRAIGDYETILPDSTLVDLDPEKRLGFDVLATYLVNPWTAVYLGYTDNYENWRLDPLSARRLGYSSRATASVGRQVFLKVSYLLRY